MLGSFPLTSCMVIQKCEVQHSKEKFFFFFFLHRRLGRGSNRFLLFSLSPLWRVPPLLSWGLHMRGESPQQNTWHITQSFIALMIQLHISSSKKKRYPFLYMPVPSVYCTLKSINQAYCKPRGEEWRNKVAKVSIKGPGHSPL